jgi:hypothetical protein
MEMRRRKGAIIISFPYAKLERRETEHHFLICKFEERKMEREEKTYHFF